MKTASKTRKKTPSKKAPSMKVPSKKGPSTKAQSKQSKIKKTPRTRKPNHMTLLEWQTALRREYGREQNFDLKNIGDDPIFSDFLVTNPESKNTYRIAIRGNQTGDNYCSCPDFAVNLLGTCKHIEFTLARLERKRGAKKRFREGFTPAYSEVFLHYGKERKVIFKPGSECPDELREHASKYFTVNGELKPNAYLKFHSFLKNAPTNGHDLRCFEDAIQFIAQLRDDDERLKKINQKFKAGINSAKFNKLLKTNLYPYQRKGALFAAKAGRCLIGDDMGLGKTIQAIAATEILAEVAGVERVLIICPTSLKHQWRKEIEKFVTRSVEVIEGNQFNRKTLYQTNTFYKIANYELVYRDLESMSNWSPDIIILDEAQRIKNWSTRRAQSVKQLKSQYAFVLTGTPLENRLEELHSIVEFVDCFRLGPLYRYLAEHQHIDEFGKVIGYKNLDKISKTIEPILIRRTKDEVLKELPECVQKHYFVPMTPQQRDYHEEGQETVARIVNKWRRLGFLTETDQRILMVALQKMRMSCNSTYLIDKETDHGQKADEAIMLIDELLENNNTKIVVFSQWLATHQLMINRLQSKPYDHVFFHGSLNSQVRGELIQQFNHDPNCRIFFSTDSGGVGLNLQNASVVLNMDQPWNPAVLEQRIGRVHRLGQQNSVFVYNFIAERTIEHSMLDVIKFKKSVFAGVLDGGETEVFLGGTKLNKFMETVDQVSQKFDTSVPVDDDLVIDDQESLSEKDTTQSKPHKLPTSNEALWSDLISTGLEFVTKISQNIESSQHAGNSSPFVQKDKNTGETYLKIPMPDEKTMKTITEIANPLLNALKDWLKK